MRGRGKKEGGGRKEGIKEYGAAPAQTAMKLPSSRFYCLSVLRGEPERRSRLSRYGRGGGRGGRAGEGRRDPVPLGTQ